MSPALRVITAFIATYAAGLAGYFFIDTGLESWYANLLKPALMPPSSVFSIVWTILYACMATAFAIVWIKKTEASEGWIRFYFLNLLFNAGWVIFFFGFHAILIAFFTSLFLAFIVLALLISALEIDRRASYLLIPYLLWVLFAAYLNLSIWLMN